MPDQVLVAIVGRPNVGKSRLFNCLARRRLSIVHDKPGVTRDIVTADCRAGYTLMDTGGIGLEDKDTPIAISEATESQAEFAILAANLILFVTDGREGVTTLDMQIAELLRPHQKKVLLVVNKIDHPENQNMALEMAQLGMGDPLSVSAEHKLGIDDLEDEILERLGPITSPETKEIAPASRIALAMVGRPNAGKSSLGNRLLKSERLIVADLPGTTRDTIETALEYTDRKAGTWNVRLFDTAGLRQKKKVDSSVEYFSSVRTRRSIENADIVLLLIDAKEGVTKQDKIIAGEILDSGKPIIVVVTKWDFALESFKQDMVEGFRNLIEFKQSYEKALRAAFYYLPETPIVFTSAKSGDGIEDMMEQVVRINRALDTRLPTPKLNQTLLRLMENRQPTKLIGRRFKVYYATQIGNRPFKIKMFCNREDKLQVQYRRYLERSIVREFKIEGCPVFFNLIGKPAKEKRD
ncbi:MAG: ribosome biogenesis GTPase Der [Opitutales bacterium]|nr:ribosome biogenesis GTPase Der [Opitutales bacterium]